MRIDARKSQQVNFSAALKSLMASKSFLPSARTSSQASWLRFRFRIVMWCSCHWVRGCCVRCGDWGGKNCMTKLERIIQQKVKDL